MMTSIVGLITNSVGEPLEGALTVRLTRTNTADETVPDTIYTMVPKVFNIVAGVVDVEIPQTETYEIPYNIAFVEAGETEPLFSVSPIIPRVLSVELASFFPTGITGKNIDTGAVRIARLLAKDQTLSQLIKQPAIFLQSVTGQASEFKAYIPKPFAGSIQIKALSVLGLSGYELWDFGVGILNSNGNEDLLVEESVATVTENGRRRIFLSYNISRAASVMGAFIVATPQSGAASFSGTLALSFTELN